MATISGSSVGDHTVRVGVSDYRSRTDGNTLSWVKRSSIRGDGSWELTLGPGFYVLETLRHGKPTTSTPIVIPNDGAYAIEEVLAQGSSDNSYSGGMEY